MRKILIIAAVFAMANVALAQNDSIHFENKSWAGIKDKALKENKLIFADIHTSWCKPCRKMDNEVYVNDTVAQFFNENFICVKINAEKDEGPDLAKYYDVRSLPTLIFTDAEGNMVHRACGYKDPQKFLAFGREALDPEKQLCKSVKRHLKGDRNPDFMASYVNSLDNACLPVIEILRGYFPSQKDSDLLSPANWQIINRYVYTITCREFQYFLNNRDKFSALYGDSAVSRKIYDVYLDNFRTIAEDTAKDNKKYRDFKDEVKKINFIREEELFAEADMDFYKKSEDWNSFIMVTNSGSLEKYFWANPDMLNALAWDYYEHVNDAHLLEYSLKLVRRSIELDSRPNSIDTYAHLLFKLGRVADAVDMETAALKLAVETKENPESYKKALKKFSQEE